MYDPPKDRDFDIDDLQWDVEDLSSTYEDLIVPLQKITNADPIDHQVKQNIDVNICKVGCEESTHDIGRRSNGRMGLSTVGLEEMSRHFYVPINQAAKEMKIGLTALKKRCRELGISRWPHRKMKSLKTLIHSVQGNDEERLRREIEALKEQKALMEMWPEMDLPDRTKKLRQACFKANFTKRRIMGAP
ncbi:Protein RKD3 [Acorus gramineus]|uniref:Protein RKD3 n=1 Tax=Acorus gramineus TaxID=55184 RepID=A0AAV9AWD8_ACOGR|nr:Protein RKD3 [Acorus gramineus]